MAPLNYESILIRKYAYLFVKILSLYCFAALLFSKKKFFWSQLWITWLDVKLKYVLLVYPTSLYNSGSSVPSLFAIIFKPNKCRSTLWPVAAYAKKMLIRKFTYWIMIYICYEKFYYSDTTYNARPIYNARLMLFRLKVFKFLITYTLYIIYYKDNIQDKIHYIL